MKRIFTLMLALCLCLTGAVFPVQASDDPEKDDRANSWRYSDGEPITSPAAPIGEDEAYHPDATLVGVDVSHHQGKINWEAVRDAGIDFAILRCGYGMDQTDQDDASFAYNAAECERLGIPYGVYLYSYATTVERADSEADHVLRLIEGKKLSYPVYYDMEDNSTIGSDLAAIAQTFCNKVSEAGYPVGVYANLYWWNEILTDPCFDSWHRWVAYYSTSCSYEGEYQIWQYTNTGSVSGIEGNADLNFQIGFPDDHGPCALSHTCEETVVPPTCTEMGYTIYVCTVCGTSFSDDYVDPTGHMLPDDNTEWLYNRLNHWYACSCGELLQTEEHVFNNEDASVCTVCGCDPASIPIVSGDLNSDGAVDDADVSLLLWYTLFPDLYEIQNNADFTGDTLVDDEDVSYLLWHTLFPDMYPLD